VQIKEECDKFGSSSEIKNTVVYGGVPKHKQIFTLREGIEIVIATPVSTVCLVRFFLVVDTSYIYPVRICTLKRGD
jgi:superfamily II DNA/RNA helicase